MDERKVQELCDKQEITEVLQRYCRANDRIDGELMASCYHPDARDSHGTFDGPASEYMKFSMEILESDQFEMLTHFIGPPLIELDGDVAWVETYVLAFHRVNQDGAKTDHLASGRYADRFERRDGDWRIADRQFLADWTRSDPVTREYNGEDMGEPFKGGSRDRNDPVYSRVPRSPLPDPS